MTALDHKPNLFIIGAMKSGTTSLHEYLSTHPAIGMSQVKEPGYFAEELTWHRGEAWYLGLFPQNGPYRYRGESSTQYTMLPTFQGVAPRLHRFNPHARLLYIMRNPFERTLSHYWHNVRVRNPREGGGEPRSLRQAVREQPRYLAYSDYATQLTPYVELFGRDALYALTFESLVANPQQELDRIYRWLDLPPHPLGEHGSRAHNQKPAQLTVAAGRGLLYRIRFSRTWHRLSPWVPSGLKRFAQRKAERPIDERQLEQERTLLKQDIGDLQRQQVERLSKLLGRGFPEWHPIASTSDDGGAARDGLRTPHDHA